MCERHIRSVGKDALVSFGASVYSVPWTKVRPRQRVELRVTRDAVEIHTIGEAPEHLATQARAAQRGTWVVDERHWDGLPDGTSPAAGPTTSPATSEAEPQDDQVNLLMRRANAFSVPVARRDPGTYDRAFHTQGGAW